MCACIYICIHSASFSDQGVEFLLSKLNPDFVIGNKISHSIYGQTNLRLQSKQSRSVGGSFRLVAKAGFRFSFLLDRCS